MKAPHFQRQVLSITEKNQLAVTSGFLHPGHRLPTLYFRSLDHAPLLHLVANNVDLRVVTEIMLRWLVLTDEMEVLPLSLSRLQVLCHSLSKVLFKLSLTLLVRYRSSYFIFNFGRHIPAASHCTPKQCYSLSTSMRHSGFWLNGLPPSWLNTHMKGCIQQWVCFAH